MLDQSSHCVGSQTAHHHWEHVNSGHERGVVEDSLEIEGDPEREDWKSNESESDNHEQLMRVSSIQRKTVSY